MRRSIGAARAKLGARAALAALAASVLLGCVTVPREYAPDIDLVRVSSAIPGAWYAGDLHCHSTHSDGDSPVATVIARAESRGLDFLALTDHDSWMKGATPHWDDPSYRSERMALLYGVEWTTKVGHANVIAARPFDYAPLWQANRDLSPEAAAAAAREQGAIFSINHPENPLVLWEYEYVDGDGRFIADALEVWNGPFLLPSRNDRTLRSLWDELLVQGLRVTGVGGSDNHQIDGIQASFNLHGAPTTWVFASALTPEDIMDGIGAGRVSIAYRPGADRLEFLADTSGDGVFDAMMGDEIPAGRETIFCVAAIGPHRRERGLGAGRRYVCEIWKNGKLFTRIPLREGSGQAATFTDVPLPGDYYRAVLRGRPRVGLLQRITMGRTLALTNPIYVGR